MYCTKVGWKLEIYRCQQHWVTCNFAFVYNLHYLRVLFIFIGP